MCVIRSERWQRTYAPTLIKFLFSFTSSSINDTSFIINKATNAVSSRVNENTQIVYQQTSPFFVKLSIISNNAQCVENQSSWLIIRLEWGYLTAGSIIFAKDLSEKPLLALRSEFPSTQNELIHWHNSENKVKYTDKLWMSFMIWCAEKAYVFWKVSEFENSSFQVCVHELNRSITNSFHILYHENASAPM